MCVGSLLRVKRRGKKWSFVRLGLPVTHPSTLNAFAGMVLFRFAAGRQVEGGSIAGEEEKRIVEGERREAGGGGKAVVNLPYRSMHSYRSLYQS